MDHIISHFADDTQFFSDESQQGLQTIEETLGLMENNIGFQINRVKMHLYLLGGAKSPPCNFVVNDGHPYLLGIDTVPNSLQLINVLQNAEAVLNSWLHRGLTLYGRILVVNSLVGPLYNHVMQCVTNPMDQFFQKHDKIVENFLWSGKKLKIPMQLLHCAKPQAGLKLVHLWYKCMSLKIQWESFVNAKNLLKSYSGIYLMHSDGDSWSVP